MKDKTTYKLSRNLQIFIVSAFTIGTLAADLPTIRHIIDQYPSNPNLSGYYDFIVQALIITLLSLAVISWLSPQRTKLAKFTDGVVLTTSLGLLLSFVNIVSASLVYTPTRTADEVPLGTFRLVVTVIQAVIVLGLWLALAYWRKTGRWSTK